MDSPHKGQWRGALICSWICAWTKGWANHRVVDDLARHHAHYNVTDDSENTMPWPFIRCHLSINGCKSNICLSKFHGPVPAAVSPKTNVYIAWIWYQVKGFGTLSMRDMVSSIYQNWKKNRDESWTMVSCATYFSGYSLNGTDYHAVPWISGPHQARMQSI